MASGSQAAAWTGALSLWEGTSRRRFAGPRGWDSLLRAFVWSQAMGCMKNFPLCPLKEPSARRPLVSNARGRQIHTLLGCLGGQCSFQESKGPGQGRALCSLGSCKRPESGAWWATTRSTAVT